MEELEYAKNLLKINKQNDNSLWVESSFAQNGTKSGYRIEPKGNFYGIPYKTLLENANFELELDDFKDEYKKIARLIKDENFFFVEYPPCCLMSEKEINEYIKFLKSKKKKDYTKQTLENINIKLEEAYQALKINDYLSEEDLKAKVVKEYKIDRYRNILLSFVNEEYDGLKIFLTDIYDSDKNFLICKKGYFSKDDIEIDKNTKGEFVIRISTNIVKKTKEFLEEIKVPIMPDKIIVLDGKSRSIKIKGGISEYYFFSWSAHTENTEPLHRLSIFLINFAKKYLPANY